MGTGYCLICKNLYNDYKIINDKNWNFPEIICEECKQKIEKNKKDKQLKYLQIAEIYASMSHCCSHKVGSVLVKDGRILATGMNGTPSGYKNCDEVFPDYNKEVDRKIHMEFSDKYETHAEASTLIQAAREGISIKDTILYCTHQPCWQCLKMIISAGIKEIYFKHLYDRIGTDKNWWDFASENGVKVEHITEDIKN